MRQEACPAVYPPRFPGARQGDQEGGAGTRGAGRDAQGRMAQDRRPQAGHHRDTGPLPRRNRPRGTLPGPRWCQGRGIPASLCGEQTPPAGTGLAGHSPDRGGSRSGAGPWSRPPGRRGEIRRRSAQGSPIPAPVRGRPRGDPRLSLRRIAPPLPDTSRGTLSRTAVVSGRRDTRFSLRHPCRGRSRDAPPDRAGTGAGAGRDRAGGVPVPCRGPGGPEGDPCLSLPIPPVRGSAGRRERLCLPQ